MLFLHSYRFSTRAARLTALAAIPFFGFVFCSMNAVAQETAANTPVATVTPAAPAQPAGGDVKDLLKKIENDETTKNPSQPVTPPAPLAVNEIPGANPPANPAAVAVPVEAAPTPAVTPTTAAPLLTPQEVDETKVPQPEPIKAATDVPGVPAVVPDALGGSTPETKTGAADENMFFDSDSLKSKGGEGAPTTASTVPLNVNPTDQPASGMIVVTRDFDSGSDQAQMVAAQRAIQLRRYDAALRLYSQLYEKNNQDPNVLLGMAVAYQKLGQNEEAIKSYEELLQIKPDNVEAQINMLGLIGEHYPAVALQRLETLSNDHPNDVRVLAQAAVIQARTGHYDEALTSLGMAASLDANNAGYVFNMAVIADRAGKKEEAVGYYEKALEIDSVYGGSSTIPRDSVYERLAKLR